MKEINNYNTNDKAVSNLQYLMDLPLTILKQLLVTFEIEEVKCLLIYAYTVNKDKIERYRESAARWKAMLSF